ncbi:MAG: hypothetical protein MJA83_10255 [Gammaproteobacteria bacterium]|nr:hypothetical protein [Gammaproteobacteria bacterium]
MNPIEKHAQAKQDFLHYTLAAAIAAQEYMDGIHDIDEKDQLLKVAMDRCRQAYGQMATLEYLENQTIEDVSG